MTEEAGGRWCRAAAALGVSREDVPSRLADSAGLPQPVGALAIAVITGALDILDVLVPVGVVETDNDLFDASTDFGHQTIPPIAPEIFAAQAQIHTAVSGLPTRELWDTAQQLGVKSATVETGAQITAIRERARVRRQCEELLSQVAFEPVGYPPVDDAVAAAENADFESAVESILNSVRTRGSGEWDEITVEAVCCAVMLHLARIGDVFLHASE